MQVGLKRQNCYKYGKNPRIKLRASKNNMKN